MVAKQKVYHDGKRSSQTYRKGKKVLVLNKHCNTGHLVTYCNSKAPMTYMVTLTSHRRLCQVNHLLYSRGSSTDSEPYVDDVPDLELTST